MATPSSDQRMDAVLQSLRLAEGSVGRNQLLVVGEPLPISGEAGASFLRGHGTQTGEDGQVRATVCGVLQRVNKLVTVQPLRTCYVAQTGDILLGRVVEVGPRRWKVDVGAGQEAGLMLSAVNLPGGIQRRKTSVDELNMRAMFVEGDVLTAEVQSTHQDGSIVLHTRSEKYGKVHGGQLVVVSPYLIKRLKHHFVTLSCGVQVVLGCNGWVWVGVPPPTALKDEDLDEEEEERVRREAAAATVPKALREKICRVAHSVRALAHHGFPVEPASMLRVYSLSLTLGARVKDMGLEEFLIAVAESEAATRTSGGKQPSPTLLA